jgi:hypothetical protein
MNRLLGTLLLFVIGVSVVPSGRADDSGPAKAGNKISWKKITLDTVFRSEGVAAADVNKDGKVDILVGDYWYEAPDWKKHEIRKPHDHGDGSGGGRKGYSNSFACWADDFNGDGWADLIVIGWPGDPCHWYENPKGKPGHWKEHLLSNSACNETPIYVDLFKEGKRVLVMGSRPPGKPGEVCYFRPGKDSTQPWDRYSISGPSKDGKDVPGSFHFYHGLGRGDINGDGRLDVIIPDGWWEQPEKQDGRPWKWHPTKIGSGCADMHVLDVDGDAKVDVVSSSGHGYGLWWHQQKPGKDGPAFLTHDLFPPPPALAKEPQGHPLKKEEKDFYAALNQVRQKQLRSPWRANETLCKLAREWADDLALGRERKDKNEVAKKSYAGKLLLVVYYGTAGSPQELAEVLLTKHKERITGPGLEVGIGFGGSGKAGYYTVLIGDRNQFALPGQTHALHLVDINGDGLKDLVTGRRWWAHGKAGDVSPADPPYLYWFEAQKSPDGIVRFIPRLIDDGSGVGTQFTIDDLDGDGLPDIAISNKRGVFLFFQARSKPK